MGRTRMVAVDFRIAQSDLKQARRLPWRSWTVSDRTHPDPASSSLIAARAEPPLVVDLDGTLTPSDLLIESAFRLAQADPLALWRLPLWLAEGKAVLKARLAERAPLDFALLPLDTTLLAFLHAERARGRRIFLASASDRRYVQALAEHVGLFDGVFASDGAINLAGAEKARILAETFGAKGFDYVGNATADLAVWAVARRAHLVDCGPDLAAAAGRACADIHHLRPPAGRGHQAHAWLRAVRAHQWLKNLLVFLPALASHSLNPATLGAALVAFLAFSACASSVYLLNDLVDLPSDRAHPTKRHRPFASGTLPLAQGLILIPLLLVLAGALATLLPAGFGIVLALYYGVTLLYTLTLKRRIVVDVLTLAGLYTLRVLAGAAATAILVSEWLLAFSMFLFLCLALIKRYSELMERVRTRKGRPAGRAYVPDDTPMIGALAGASGFVSVLVLALYINSPAVHALYPHPERLWGIGILLMYWVARVLMLAHRGVLHDDPVVFAVKDRTSLAVAGLMGLTVVAGALP